MELTYSNTFTAWLSAFSDGYFQFFLLLRPPLTAFFLSNPKTSEADKKQNYL
jgi:hypothetical protein